MEKELAEQHRNQSIHRASISFVGAPFIYLNHKDLTISLLQALQGADLDAMSTSPHWQRLTIWEFVECVLNPIPLESKRGRAITRIWLLARGFCPC